MDYPKFIVSNQKGEPISIQRVKKTRKILKNTQSYLEFRVCDMKLVGLTLTPRGRFSLLSRRKEKEIKDDMEFAEKVL